MEHWMSGKNYLPRTYPAFHQIKHLQIFELLTFSAICPLSTTSVMLPILLYRLFGKFPPEMIRLSTRGAGYFEDDGAYLTSKS